ncbi:MAG: Ldh family oxidoreductase [Candidatus Thioglobus sp.]
MNTTTLNKTEIEQITIQALTNSGASLIAASSMARGVVAAEMDGISSHGLIYVPIYCEHLVCGKVSPNAEPSVNITAPSAITVDADCGFAHPAIDAGFNLMIESAKKNGCAAMSIKNSYNCGVLGYHTERIARTGLTGLGYTNAPASIMPVGGDTPVIGTNPFSLALPNGKGGVAFVIDQSASVVAKSEIKMHALAGKPIPEGWAYDSDGNITTDAEKAMLGSMAPVGGYKGFGTGLMVESFAAVMSGASLGKDASPFAGTSGGPPKTGQFFFAVSPELFSHGLFAEKVESLTESIESQDGARLPGTGRFVNRDTNERSGVEISTELLEKIRSI